MKNLPSLRSLRYFEVAARHMSFTRAAKELDVTQSAISHRIRILEKQVGYTLFRRRPRHLSLTDQGEFYFSEISVAFSKIAHATEQLNPNRSWHQVEIKVTPYVSSRWLIPRLPEFSTAHPNIILKLQHTQTRVIASELSGNAGDQIVISYQEKSQPNWSSEYLFSADMVPMCNPNLIRGKRRFEQARDLLAFPLAHELDHRWWRQWFDMAGLGSEPVPKGPVFDDPLVLINSALGGQSIVLAPPLLFQNYLDAGLLVKPMADKHKIPIDYYLILPEPEQLGASARIFANWVRRQAKLMRANSEPRFV